MIQIRCDFAELFEGGFEVFDPSTRSTGWPWVLARGRPERSESRDDDFLGEDVGIGEIVGVFKAGVFVPDVEASLAAIHSQVEKSECPLFFPILPAYVAFSKLPKGRLISHLEEEQKRQLLRACPEPLSGVYPEYSRRARIDSAEG